MVYGVVDIGLGLLELGANSWKSATQYLYGGKKEKLAQIHPEIGLKAIRHY
jgi:hypothetical protein